MTKSPVFSETPIVANWLRDIEAVKSNVTDLVGVPLATIAGKPASSAEEVRRKQAEQAAALATSAKPEGQDQ